MISGTVNPFAEIFESPRFVPLRPHPEQIRLWNSRKRYNLVPAGRRSGKTEIKGKQQFVVRSLVCHDQQICATLGHPEWFVPFENPQLGVAAPTRDQAKRIYWNDLKKLIVPKYRRAQPNESMLYIPLKNGADVHCLGMDRPERAEGQPWDYLLLDEYGNMKKETWFEHLEPALNTPGREGAADFIGVPEGRNHYYRLWKDAESMEAKLGDACEWGRFHWISEDVLSPQAIASAKRNLDELTYQQEYCGDFINFSGRAYYNFKDTVQCARLAHLYRKDAPLIVALDFNVEPGIAVIGQEMTRLDPVGKLPIVGETMTGWFKEVYVPRNSNTEIVCNKVGNLFKDHVGQVKVYGDASGGARGSAKVMGSDWDIAEKVLKSHFGGRVKMEVPRKNPGERERVNAVNSRFLSTDGVVKMMVDPSGCPKLVIDFEGVRLIEGGSGEIDKKHDSTLTHLSDAVGYYVNREHPIAKLSGGMANVKGT